MYKVFLRGVRVYLGCCGGFRRVRGALRLGKPHGPKALPSRLTVKQQGANG